MIIQILTSLLHFVWCYLFITLLGMEVVGAGLATSITYSLNYILILLYCHSVKELDDTWVPLLSKESFDGLLPYFYQAIPFYFMIAMPQLTLEIATLMAGYLTMAMMSTQTILNNASLLAARIPHAFMYASSTFIGIAIG